MNTFIRKFHPPSAVLSGRPSALFSCFLHPIGSGCTLVLIGLATILDDWQGFAWIK